MNKYIKNFNSFINKKEMKNEAFYGEYPEYGQDDNEDEGEDNGGDGFFNDEGNWVDDDENYSKSKMYAMLDEFPELRAEYDSLIDGYSSDDILRNLYHSYVLQDSDMESFYNNL